MGGVALAAVLGVLLALGVACEVLLWSRSHAMARRDTASCLIRQLDQAIESYASDYGAYPHSDGAVWTIHEAPALVIHYRCPGLLRPGRFDLWATDSQGNPQGIHNW